MSEGGEGVSALGCRVRFGGNWFVIRILYKYFISAFISTHVVHVCENTFPFVTPTHTRALPRRLRLP